MEKIVEQGILYDFYGELLTDHQRKVYESVVYDNLSLGEIADDLGISRQAVHDLIKRTDRILADYESKLGLVKKFDKVKKSVLLIEKETDGSGKEDIPEDKKKRILDICRDIKDIMAQ